MKSKIVLLIIALMLYWYSLTLNNEIEIKENIIEYQQQTIEEERKINEIKQEYYQEIPVRAPSERLPLGVY